MYKIIRPATEYKKECCNCGCRFAYDMSDVYKVDSKYDLSKYVKCPICEEVYIHYEKEND